MTMSANAGGNAMKPKSAVVRRTITAIVVVAGLGALVGMKSVREFVDEKLTSQFHKSESEDESETTIVVTTPKLEDVTNTETNNNQIRSQRHIEVRTLEGGYINQIA